MEEAERIAREEHGSGKVGFVVLANALILNKVFGRPFINTYKIDKTDFSWWCRVKCIAKLRKASASDRRKRSSSN